MAKTKRAVVIFNLGGPDSQAAVQPFLFNLFYDRAIINVPNPMRWMIAKLISSRRVKEASAIYEELGGGSPIVPQTQAQADALANTLNARDPDAAHKVFIAMRYWHPFVEEAAEAVQAWGAEEVVLLPLYPQFSITTTQTGFKEWDRLSAKMKVDIPSRRLCCYPTEGGWVEAQATLIRAALEQGNSDDASIPLRVLFSAHGLPKRTVAQGDPYPDQVEMGAQAIVDTLQVEGLDWQVCYQSRVGPLEWIGPSIDEALEKAATDKVGVVVVPIAFVSEHSETLVELDIEYRDRAKELSLPAYYRVPTVGVEPSFIGGLADMVLQDRGACNSEAGRRVCNSDCSACPL
jgi:ferrochelatase